jgi:AraC family transcriptional regulator
MNEIASFPRIERVVDLRRRIHRVVDFIDENLDTELSLEHLAEIACISPYHFHRLYSRMVGQSPADTVRHLRLMRATSEIRVEGMSVTQAALTAGYGSPQAFARAYRREFGHSPTEMRVMGSMNATQRQAFDEFTIVNRPPLEMEALMYDGQRGQADVLAIDAQVYSQLLGTGHREIMSVYFGDLMTPASQRFRCALCFCLERRDRMPPGLNLERLQIAGGNYACVEQRGVLLDLAPQWQRFVGQILPSFGWVARPGPILRLLVSDRAITPPSQRLSYLYVPVERLTSH